MEHNEQLLNIILSEYRELRIELMYFISEQRKHIGMMISLIAGQSILLLNTEKLHYELIAYIYLFVIPFLIFILMIRTLEATANILIVADYIHKGIKPQLTSLFNGKPMFFQWEEHKASTNRFSIKLLKFLEYTRWYIFTIGIISSSILGYWFYVRVDNYSINILILSVFLNVIWSIITVLVSGSFSEVGGETINYKIDLK